MTKRYAKSTIEERSVARRMRCLMQEQAQRSAARRVERDRARRRLTALFAATAAPTETGEPPKAL